MTSTAESTDRIEKQIHLKAPRSRVWRAITNPKEFGTWFHVAFTDEPFKVGARVRAPLTYEKYAHITLDIIIEKIEPETRFAYRWHPNAIDTTVDYSNEPMTLVEFTLEDSEGGTLLTVVESGFDSLPENRRVVSFRGNEGGWKSQMTNIEKYLETAK